MATVRENYCKSCFRTISPDRETCAECTPKRGRGAALVGIIALPLLITGMLMFNHRLVAAAAVIAAVAVVVSVVATLRG